MPELAVVAEAEAIVEGMSEALDAAEAAATPVEEPAVEVVAENLDEDTVLAELMREEELLKHTEPQEEPVETVAEVGLSVDDLDSFTLDEVAIADEEEEDEEPEEEGLDFGGLPVLTPDAGKIRFAEDIVEEVRGGGRRGGGGRRRGGGGGSRRR